MGWQCHSRDWKLRPARLEGNAMTCCGCLGREREPGWHFGEPRSLE